MQQDEGGSGVPKGAGTTDSEMPSARLPSTEHGGSCCGSLRETAARKVRESIRRCHVNLGHPSRERFLHMLKSANANPQAIRIAKELKCSTCEASRPRESHRVVRTTRAQAFSQQICMDTFEFPLKPNKKISMLNIVDEATNIQICVPLWEGKKAEHVRAAYRKNWKRWADVPRRVLTDGGTEFDGAMRTGLELGRSFVEKTAAYSPWQNGITERAGDVWKQAFAKAVSESQPSSKSEFREIMD